MFASSFYGYPIASTKMGDVRQTAVQNGAKGAKGTNRGNQPDHDGGYAKTAGFVEDDDGMGGRRGALRKK